MTNDFNLYHAAVCTCHDSTGPDCALHSLPSGWTLWTCTSGAGVVATTAQSTCTCGPYSVCCSAHPWKGELNRAAARIEELERCLTDLERRLAAGDVVGPRLRDD